MTEFRMTKRTLSPAVHHLAMAAVISVAATASLTGCPAPDDPTDIRQPFLDEWVTEAELPAAQFVKLSIGDRISSDNFSNRGNIEVVYEAGTDVITIEMQRFTIAKSEADAQEAFGRMQYWGFNLSSPEKPTEELEMTDGCGVPDPDNIDTCYVRAYYDGLFQPVRDGANFRVTIPAGWEGDLELTTSDNLEEGIDTYPDRSDVTVDGLNGNLLVDMDSGNVNVRLDPNIKHFAGCSANDDCEAMDYAMGCGCSEPTNVSIANKSGQASNITVDVGAADNWYTMILENRGTFSSSDDFVCNATIDCGAFADCVIDPDYAALESQERAEINFPGTPAVEGAGIRISLVSEACANIRYVDGIEDYDTDPLPEEKRGELRACVGCL
jgi:hypothetical protein